MGNPGDKLHFPGRSNQAEHKCNFDTRASLKGMFSPAGLAYLLLRVYRTVADALNLK